MNILSFIDGQEEIMLLSRDNALNSTQATKLISYEDRVLILGNHTYTSLGADVKINLETLNEIFVEALYVNGKEREISDEMELRAGENNLVIELSQILYSKSIERGFYYRVSPNSEDWSFSKNSSLSFLNLAPGSYQIDLATEPQSSNIKSVSFIITEVFWKSIWFWTLIGCAIAGIVLWWQARRAQRKRELIRVESEMNQLKYSALRSQINSHFIYNSLNSIQNLILKKKTDDSLLYLGSLSKLLRSVFDNSNNRLISLKLELESIQNYIKMEQLRFPERFELKIDCKAADELQIPPLLLQPMIENAVLHGVLSSENFGHIKLKFRENERLLFVEIEDNGIGYRAKQAQQQASKFQLPKSGNQRQNSGLQVCKRRIAALCSEYQVSDRFEMIDLMETEGKQGTLINFQIPKIKIHEGNHSG